MLSSHVNFQSELRRESAVAPLDGAGDVTGLRAIYTDPGVYAICLRAGHASVRVTSRMSAERLHGLEPFPAHAADVAIGRCTFPAPLKRCQLGTGGSRLLFDDAPEPPTQIAASSDPVPLFVGQLGDGPFLVRYGRSTPPIRDTEDRGEEPYAWHPPSRHRLFPPDHGIARS